MKAGTRKILPLVIVLPGLFVNQPASGQQPGATRTTSPPNREVLEVTRTNWLPRIVTNVTEIRVPTNVFVTSYHTNWVEQWVTNIIEVYKPIWQTQTLTNVVPVELWHTNRVTAYQTNLKTIIQTNWVTVTVTQTNFVQQPVTNFVEVFNTNIVTWTLTRGVPVEVVQTNVVLAYHTNWRTLTLTNWETVVLFRTNWVRRFATNIVEVEMVSGEPAEGEKAAPLAVTAEPQPVASTGEDAADYVLDMARTSKPASGGQVEVVLKLKPATGSAASMEVQSWRVERADMTVLLFGQGAEFKSVLPTGVYNLEIKARRDANSPFSTLRAAISVTPETVTLQRPLTIVKRTI